MSKISKSVFLITIAILFLSCGKEDSQSSTIPDSRVEINIQTTLNPNFKNPFYSQKYYSNKNGIVYAGYVGVIAISNTDASYIYAYDLCCPYEAPAKNELEIEGSFKLKCPKCGSIYDLLNGAESYLGGKPTSGPSTTRLKQYSVYVDGNFYKIRN